MNVSWWLTHLGTWVGLVFAGLTALFAGLVWRIARANVRAHFNLFIDDGPDPQSQRFSAILHLDNRSPKRIVIDRIEAARPASLRIGPRGAAVEFDPVASKVKKYHELDRKELDVWLVVAPGQTVTYALDLAIAPGERRGTASVRVRFRTEPAHVLRYERVDAPVPPPGKKARVAWAHASSERAN